MPREGVVLRSISSFYEVLCEGSLVTCQVRGRLKKEKVRVLIGDRVRIEEAEKKENQSAMITEVLPRRALLRRPLLANVDRLIIVFATDRPPFNPRLLDRFLILAATNEVQPVICFNKIDLVDEERLREISRPYQELGYPVIQTAAKLGIVKELLPWIEGKLSVFAGPSGVGKSKILSKLCPGLELVSGEVSEKLGRGTHTTRHASLYPVVGGLVADTPGFSLLEFEGVTGFAGYAGITPEALGWLYPEMAPHIPECKLSKCLHHLEPQCAVKEKSKISPERYANYLLFLQELMGIEQKQQSTSFKVDQTMKNAGERQIIRLGSEARMESRQQINQHLRALAETAEEDSDLDENEE
ncbi:MAG TPA: ribosome small subunit-dependent GTPase A [Chroococcales cyanobacterium]|jgi:ribosome biogenesis GTPase